MIWALADFLVWERHGPERDGACTVWQVMEGGVGAVEPGDGSGGVRKAPARRSPGQSPEEVP